MLKLVGDPAGGKCAGIGRPGQMLVETRGAVARCQPENVMVFPGQCLPDVVGDDAGGCFAHVRKVSGDDQPE